MGTFFAAKAQDNKVSSPALQEAKNLNVEVVKLFQQGKFEEALPIAQKVVQIREKELGKDHIETAQAMTNAGFVYYFLKNGKEAEKNFEGALAVFDKQNSPNKEESLLAADVLEMLAFIKYSFGKPDIAESHFERALLAYEKAGEKDSLKAGKILLSLGGLRSGKRDFVKASNFFEQALAIRIKKLGEKNFDTIEAFDNSACVLKKADKEKEIKRIQETYFPTAELTENGNLKWLEDTTKESQKPAGNGVRIIGMDSKPVDGSVINGKALSLPKPAYPAGAREARASGTVKVKVRINEQGDVVYACGAFNNVHKALTEASEAAAYGAKFNPTLVDGKPIKVNGVIVYNFIAPR